MLLFLQSLWCWGLLYQRKFINLSLFESDSRCDESFPLNFSALRRFSCARPLPRRVIIVITHRRRMQKSTVTGSQAFTRNRKMREIQPHRVEQFGIIKTSTSSARVQFARGTVIKAEFLITREQQRHWVNWTFGSFHCFSPQPPL